MRILACGSRDWDNLQKIREVLCLCEDLFGEYTLIHGACRGADQLAGKISQDREMVTVSIPARWNKYGRRAGPIRNARMLERGKPDLVIAFHDDIGGCSGTADMVSRAHRADVPTLVVTGESPIDPIRDQLIDLISRG